MRTNIILYHILVTVEKASWLMKSIFAKVRFSRKKTFVIFMFVSLQEIPEYPNFAFDIIW